MRWQWQGLLDHDYMQYLKAQFNYTSLKMQYMEEQFPALGKKSTEGGFGNIVELQADHEDAEGVDQAISDLNALREELAHTKAKLKVEQNIAGKAVKKLEHVEKVASQRIVESMPGANFEEDSNHLAMLLSTVMQHDDFEYNEETDKVDPRPSSDFLKRIEDHCNDIPDMEAKLTTVRNKVLEKLKRTVRRERRLSTSVGSMRSASRTRQRSEEAESESEHVPKLSRSSLPKSMLPGPAQVQS